MEEGENIKVSYDFIYKTLTKVGILFPKARKKTKREFAKRKLLKENKINLSMSDEQINKIVNHEIALEDSLSRQEKPKYFGDIIEQNGTIHLWFGDKKFKSVFEKSTDEEKINYTLAILTPRKLDNGNSIKYYGKYYQPYLNNELKCFMTKTDCLVIKAFSSDLLVTIDKQVLELKELSRNERFSKNFDEVIEVKE